MEIDDDIHINNGDVVAESGTPAPETEPAPVQNNETKISKSVPILKRSTVKYATAAKWSELFDPKGEWLEIESEGGMVRKITCKICRKHEDRIKQSSYFSRTFVQGISGDSLKKDNVGKHMITDMHTLAAYLEKKGRASLSIDELYNTTPNEQEFTTASDNQKEQVLKLFEIAYMIAKTDCPFTRFEDIVKMEMRHGVDLGSTYHNNKSCADFVKIISGCLMTDIVRAIKESMYYYLFIDGAAHNTTVEKALLYVGVCDAKGNVQFYFVR